MENLKKSKEYLGTSKDRTEGGVLFSEKVVKMEAGRHKTNAKKIILQFFTFYLFTMSCHTLSLHSNEF